MNISVIFCYYIPGSVKKASHIGARGLFSAFLLLCPAPLFGAGLLGHFLPPAPAPFFGAGLFQRFSSPAPSPLFGAGLFGHFLPPAPSPPLRRWAFWTLSSFCAPPHSWARGFFSAYLLLCPAALESFMLTFSWHRPPI